MSTQPDLSVIILTYNTRDLTLACLRSLEHGLTSPAKLETLVVDNGSIDGTADAVRSEFPQVHLIVNDTNLGFSGGNNKGLSVAQGRYLFMLNNDTEVEAGALSSLIAFMDTHAEAGACGPMLVNSDGTLQPSGRPLPSLWSWFLELTRLYRLFKPDRYLQTGRNYNEVSRVGEISGAAMLVRRDVYERLGGFDPNLFIYYEDVDWCKRIGQAGYAIYYVPQARVVHLWRGTMRNINELSYRTGQNSVRYYFRKHHGPVAHLTVQMLLVVKEVIQIGLSLFRRNPPRLALHKRMLVNVFSALPGGKAP